MTYSNQLKLIGLRRSEKNRNCFFIMKWYVAVLLCTVFFKKFFFLNSIRLKFAMIGFQKNTKKKEMNLIWIFLSFIIIFGYFYEYDVSKNYFATIRLSKDSRCQFDSMKRALQNLKVQENRGTRTRVLYTVGDVYWLNLYAESSKKIILKWAFWIFEVV